MSKIAFLFSGQGAQHVGMGADLYAASPAAKAVFDEANAVIGYDLSAICFNGPEEKVNSTEICQPGIFVTSLAALAAYKEAGGEADVQCSFAAGLSLGEYTALTFAGAIDFPDALRLVRLRGQLMQAACDAQPSGMLALNGASRDQAEALCDAVADKGAINVANILSPKQIVISGEMAGIDAAEALASKHGARRAKKLVVAGAFHSKLMGSAEEQLARRLADIPFQQPTLPVVSNVTGRPVTGADEIRSNLSRQVVASVLWADSVRYMADEGATQFYEFGPGKVLTGLLKRNAEGVSGIAINTVASLTAVNTRTNR